MVTHRHQKHFFTEVQHGLLAEKQYGVDALNHLVHRQKFI
jgi:hypothetical protein